MSSFSKDPDTGKPNWVPADKEEDVSLVTTAEAQDSENREKGVKTPGWVYYSEHVRADGHTARRVDTLVSFRRVDEPAPAPEEMTATTNGSLIAGTEFVVTFNTEPDSVTATVNDEPFESGVLDGLTWTATIPEADDVLSIVAEAEGYTNFEGTWTAVEE